MVSRDPGLRTPSQGDSCGPLTCPASWCWLFPASPRSAGAGCHHHRPSPSLTREPGHSLCRGAALPADTETRGGRHGVKHPPFHLQGVRSDLTRCGARIPGRATRQHRCLSNPTENSSPTHRPASHLLPHLTINPLQPPRSTFPPSQLWPQC